jgi:hypothetical protein
MFITLFLNTDCIDIENEKAMDLLILAIHYNENNVSKENVQMLKEFNLSKMVSQ